MEIKHKEVSLNKNLLTAAKTEIDELYPLVNSHPTGLSEEEIEDSQKEYGPNIVTKGKKVPLIKRLFDAFISPFTIILLVLSIISFFTDYLWAANSSKDLTTVIIILVMVGLSGTLRFVQETKSGIAVAKLTNMIRTTTSVIRQGQHLTEIPISELVVGDLVSLSAGDMVPADLRFIQVKDLFIAQSALTGESTPVEKVTATFTISQAVTDYPNLGFMGTNVVSGSGIGLVINTGNNTLLGEMAKSLNTPNAPTTFEKGVNAVSWVLIRFMLVMVPIVFVINGLTKGDWLQAALFAVSVAVGLTPGMLPMVVTTCLAKGAVAMSKEKVIIKNLNSIQNLGSMDILCTDKTGTLTKDKVELEYHWNIEGKEDDRVLRHAYLNSYYQTGLKNLMDVAIIDKTNDLIDSHSELSFLSKYRKIDEIPFDFQRRRMSVVVADPDGKTQIITKGAIEEMLEVCSLVEYEGEVVPLSEKMRKIVLQRADQLNESGMRVLGLAHKTFKTNVPGVFAVSDESEMVLIGYLAFLDPPKETTASALKALKDSGIEVKILTGDNEKVTKFICQQVGLDSSLVILGKDLENLNDEQLKQAASKNVIFAKLSPLEKARIVQALKQQGHTVGYMGDGINDAPAMKQADVAISVDSGVDIAKESATTILLEKDLMVLEKGVIEGRKTYANMIKYIKMTVSSNFGNMLSVLCASAFLPFLPMASLHLLILNLIYDISCTAIPWDNVDPEYTKVPAKWEANTIGKFMLFIGPTSSIFDIVTYLVLFFWICPSVVGNNYSALTTLADKTLFIALFQTGWFLESMWSQTLVIHMIRTPKVPFVQSNASLPVYLLNIFGITILTILPFTTLGKDIGLTVLPPIYFAYLIVVVIAYMALVTIVKKLYIRRYHSWL
jgi:Mg2+-importing ATPase